MNANKITAVIGSIYLIIQFLRSLSPPAEEPSSGVEALTLLFTFGIIVGLAASLFRQYSAASTTGEKVSAGSVVLPAVGLLAGLGLLFNQFGGPRHAELPPRPVASSSTIQSSPIPSPATSIPSSRSPFWSPATTSPSSSSPVPSPSKTDVIGPRAKPFVPALAFAVSEHVRLYEVAKKTRWMKSPDANAFNPAGISKQDLHDFQKAMRDVVRVVDDILNVLTKFDAADESLGSDVREYWMTQRQAYSEVIEQVNLLETNWSDWFPNGFNQADPALKPWQKKVVELQAAGARDLAAAKNVQDRIRAEAAAAAR